MPDPQQLDIGAELGALDIGAELSALMPSHRQQPLPTAKPEPQGMFMADEDWAALPINEKIRNVLGFAGKVTMGMLGGSAGADAAEHPGMTLATAAVPVGLQSAVKYGTPMMQAGAQHTITALQHPAVGGAVGAIGGGIQGGWPGALGGAALGMTGSTQLGRYARRMLPKPMTPPDVPPEAFDVAAMGDPARAADIAASQRMLEGMSRRTPPVGSRLVTSPQRPTVEQGVLQALEELRYPQRTGVQVGPQSPSGGGFSTPPDVPIPTDKTMRRLAPFAKTARARYRELSTKTILTPQEAQEMARLEPIVREQAKSVGSSYAAGGK